MKGKWNSTVVTNHGHRERDRYSKLVMPRQTYIQQIKTFNKYGVELNNY